MTRTRPIPRPNAINPDDDDDDDNDDSPDPLRRAYALFAKQHSVAASRQLRAVGITRKRERALIDDGTLVLHSPGVLLLAGAEPTWHQRAMAATLAAGASAALAGAAAARLHQLDGFDDIERIIIVINDSGRVRARKGVTVYRSRRLVDDDIEMVDGIPVTSIGLTLIHLAMHRLKTVHALESALRKEVDPATLRDVFDRWNVPGVRGPKLLIRQLDERIDRRLPRSMFQNIASALLAKHGIHMVDEWPVRDEHGRLLAELDLADVELKIGVECQSWRWHGSPAAQRKDNERKRMLRRLGWEIIELWWSDLGKIDAIVADILEARERARKLRS